MSIAIGRPVIRKADRLFFSATALACAIFLVLGFSAELPSQSGASPAHPIVSLARSLVHGMDRPAGCANRPGWSQVALTFTAR
jgi:hypothetical protein